VSVVFRCRQSTLYRDVKIVSVGVKKQTLLHAIRKFQLVSRHVVRVMGLKIVVKYSPIFTFIECCHAFSHVIFNLIFDDEFILFYIKESLIDFWRSFDLLQLSFCFLVSKQHSKIYVQTSFLILNQLFKFLIRRNFSKTLEFKVLISLIIIELALLQNLVALQII